jgi:uncharacterized protein YabE (DUF348 family)
VPSVRSADFLATAAVPSRPRYAPDREGGPVSDHLSRRAARHAHGHNHDSRARHYALRSVRPSPARVEAPEPDVWLPILDITGELELLRIEEGQGDLDAELAALQPAPHPRGADPAAALAAPPAALPPAFPTAPPAISIFSEPAEPEPGPRPAPGPSAPAARAAQPEAAPARRPAPAPAPAPAPQPAPRSLRRPDIVAHRKALRLRRRLLGTGLVVALLAACAAMAPNVLGRSEPQRDVTLTVDGQRATLTTRAATVADVLAAQGVVLHAGDRVVPAAHTEVSEDMPIRVLRAFPVTVEIDGATHAARTTRRDPAALQRDLHLAPGLMLASAPQRLERGAVVSLRTPHTVSLVADGATVPVTRTPALDVAAVLDQQHVTLGATDEVVPALDTRLADGLTITVYRLAQDQVARQEPIAFATETRADASLPRGQQKVVQEGRNGTARVVYQVNRRDGITYSESRVASSVLTPPTPRIVAVGTKAAAPAAAAGGGGAASTATGGALIQSGSATWYGTGPGPGTCAHLHLPFGTRVRIVNVATGAQATCRVADRGPMAWTGHIIDLSPDVFRALAPLGSGVISVQLYRL